jgi:hypothetical protein
MNIYKSPGVFTTEPSWVATATGPVSFQLPKIIHISFHTDKIFVELDNETEFIENLFTNEMSIISKIPYNQDNPINTDIIKDIKWVTNGKVSYKVDITNLSTSESNFNKKHIIAYFKVVKIWNEDLQSAIVDDKINNII